jgi:hypothetical protein
MIRNPSKYAIPNSMVRYPFTLLFKILPIKKPLHYVEGFSIIKILLEPIF